MRSTDLCRAPCPARYSDVASHSALRSRACARFIRPFVHVPGQQFHIFRYIRGNDALDTWWASARSAAGTRAMTAKHDNLIIDVGMHDGGDTAFYLAKGFDVVAVEADPGLAQAGAERF